MFLRLKGSTCVHIVGVVAEFEGLLVLVEKEGVTVEKLMNGEYDLVFSVHTPPCLTQ
jgi:hypothetical protein